MSKIIDLTSLTQYDKLVKGSLGKLAGTYATLAALQAAYPSGTTGNFLVEANGHWYYWDSAWTDGGTYLASTNESNLYFLKENDKDIVDYEDYELMQYLNFEQGNATSAGESENSARIRSVGYFDLSTLPSFDGWLKVKCKSGYKVISLLQYKTVSNVITYNTVNSNLTDHSIFLLSDTTHIKVVIAKTDNSNLMPGECINASIQVQLNRNLLGKIDRIDNSIKQVSQEERLDLLLGVQFENGTTSSGQDGSKVENRIRTIGYISVEGKEEVYIDLASGYNIYFNEYNKSGDTYTYLGVTTISTSGWRSLRETANAIRVVIYKSSGNITQRDANNVHIYIKNKKNSTLFYGSSTENLLDVSLPPIIRYRLTNSYPYFVSNTNDAKLSQPIPVKGLRVVHLHGNAPSPSTSLTRWCVFTKDTSMTGDSVVANSEGLGSSGEDVTLEVPAGANYLYITLAFGSRDYSSMTVTASQYKTTDAFSKDGAVCEETTDKTIDLENENYLDWIRYENQRVYAEIVKHSVGNNNGTQYQKANILFFTDSHIDYVKPDASLQNALLTFDFANKSPVPLDAIINGGDTITPFGVNTKAKEKENFARFFNKAKKSAYPVIYCKGNHDLNDWDNTPANTFDDADWSEMFLDYAETKFGIVRQLKSSGEKSTWHYYDIVDKKIRVICVDVQDTDKTVTKPNGNVFYYGGVSWYISQEQMSWIINTALNFDDKTDKGWGVVVVSHQGTGYGDYTEESPTYQDAIEKLLYVLKAFNTQTTYSSTFTFATDSFFDLTISADFTRYASETNKPHIICWLLGHEHYDKYLNQQGINVIWTTCGQCYASATPSVARIRNCVNQNSFDILSIDTVRRKISIIRYGAGENRFMGEDELSY